MLTFSKEHRKLLNGGSLKEGEKSAKFVVWSIYPVFQSRLQKETSLLVRSIPDLWGEYLKRCTFENKKFQTYLALLFQILGRKLYL